MLHRTITVLAYLNVLKEPMVLIEEESTTSRQIYGRLFENINSTIVWRPVVISRTGVLDSIENRGLCILRTALTPIRGSVPVSNNRLALV